MPYKILCGFTAAILCMFVLLPQAHSFSPLGYSSVERKEATDSFYIAMLFYKLAGYRPNFTSWVEGEEAFQKMTEMEKDHELEERVEYLSDLFRRMEAEAPIIVNTKTQMSSYSMEHGGFFIESFRPDLFFSYEHMGNHFAIIPIDIDSYQWYQVSATDLEGMGMDLTKPHKIDVQILLVPTASEIKKPARLGEFDHWVINAMVKEVQMWSEDGSRLLWVAQKRPGSDNTLLELYK